MIIHGITTLHSKPTLSTRSISSRPHVENIVLLGPAACWSLVCGTGRLITELATRGYELSGFDVSQPALRYLRRRLTRFRLYAEIFEAEMSNFRIGQPADAAYCLINTFRYLLTEQAARGHLECIACSLRPGGIYVLGLHLLASGGDKEDSGCWTQRRCKTKVTVTARLLRTDRRRRIEEFQLCMMARSGWKEVRLHDAL